MNLLEKKVDIDSFFCYKVKHKEFIKNNKSILKTQQRFKSEWHNVFGEEINKIDLSSNHGKIMQSIDSMGIYSYLTSKDLVSDKKRGD